MPSALEISGTAVLPLSLDVYCKMSIIARESVFDSCACSLSRSSSVVGWRNVVLICQISQATCS